MLSAVCTENFIRRRFRFGSSVLARADEVIEYGSSFLALHEFAIAQSGHP
jgi:hypothetical protein